jgi:hypothetical protein
LILFLNCSFKEGDLALFLPTRHPQAWAAFNVGSSHYFLHPDTATELFATQVKKRDWILGVIQKISMFEVGEKRQDSAQRGEGKERNQGDDSNRNVYNPFGLATGSVFRLCHCTEIHN